MNLHHRFSWKCKQISATDWKKESKILESEHLNWSLLFSIHFMLDSICPLIFPDEKAIYTKYWVRESHIYLSNEPKTVHESLCRPFWLCFSQFDSNDSIWCWMLMFWSISNPYAFANVLCTLWFKHWQA